jgi:hypothetical protein
MKKNILAILFFVSLSVIAQAQAADPFIINADETTVSSLSYDHETILDHSDYLQGVIIATAKEVYIETNGDDFAVLYDVPFLRDASIVGTAEQFGRGQYYDEIKVLISLSDGSSVTLYIDLATGIVVNEYLASWPYEGIGLLQTIGESNLYHISTNMLYASIDSGHTWAIDTMGLHGVNLNGMAIDTFQNVFLSTVNGLYQQAQNATIWTLNATIPLSSTSKIFVDHMNRIWAFGYNTALSEYILCHSTNDGTTWSADSLGIQYTQIENIGDDMLGNIYLVGNTGSFYNKGDQLYKSIGGTMPFTRIDQGIRAMNSQAADSGIFTTISGDSANLYAGGTRGMFKSVDGGATWSKPKGIRSNQIYGLVPTNNNKIIISNNIGCYSANAGDSVWTKTYPTNGYFSIGKPIYKDDAGEIYTEAPINNGGQHNGPYIVVKSTDNGNTWNADTMGFSSAPTYTWWVDEQGDQYAGGIATTGFNLPVSKKSATGSWAADTIGLVYDNTNDTVLSFGSDHNGKIYIANYSGSVLSQSISGGAWTLETGINSDQTYSFAHTSDHTMIAGGISNIHYKGAGGWQNMPVNAPAPGGKTVFAVAADDSDYVWAAFSHQDSTGSYTGDGVYFTPDYGNTWFAPQGQVAVAGFRALVPVGDSVFGLTYFDGVYVFKRAFAPTGISTIATAQNLVIYPNPAVNECHALFTLPASSPNNELVINDISGKSIKQIPISAGANQLSFSTQDLGTGMYFCTLMSSNKIIEVRKLVVNK